MKFVAVVVIVLAVSQLASTLVCLKVPVYNTTIANLCTTLKDNDILWPDYQNANQYYNCQGIGNPVLEKCLPNYYFNFLRQACGTCARYIPAIPCKELPGKICNPIKTAVSPPSKPTNPTVPSSCSTLATYSTSFIPNCLGNDDRLLWPNYKNMSQFYRCQGEYNPLIISCEKGLYFNFQAQKCTNCASYVPAPDCSKLHIDKSNKCQKI